MLDEFERPPRRISFTVEQNILRSTAVQFMMVMKSERDGTDPTEEADTPGWQVTGPAVLSSNI